MSELDIQAEIEAMTNLISQEGSESDKMEAILEFNARAFKELGFTYTLSAMRPSKDGFDFVGGGQFIEEDDLPEELLFLLTLTRRCVRSFIQDSDVQDCKEVIEELQSMLKAKMKNEIKDLKRELLEGMAEGVIENDDLKELIKKLLDE